MATKPWLGPVFPVPARLSELHRGMGAAAFFLSMGGHLSNRAMAQTHLPLEPGPTSSNLPHCSVVVATRNRSSNLRRLLGGLVQQTAPPAFEVVVADNGSFDDTPTVIDSFRSALALHSVHAPEPGKGRALNAALALAQGEIIVFTDDDVMPEPDWLFEIHRAANDFPTHNIFGGRIEVDSAAVPGWIGRSFNLMGLLTSAHDKGGSPVTYGYAEYPFGPNMAVRRKLLADDVRLYPEDMGPGTEQPVGDETGFFLQISPPEAQDRLFVPSARVLHEVEPENVAFGKALKRCYQAGIASGRLRLPVVSKGAISNDQALSTSAVILQRLRSTRSAQELACIISRYLGYRTGRRMKAFRVVRSVEKSNED